MALFIRQDENRTELQKRLESELQDRSRKLSKLADRPDGVEDSQYIKGTKKTTSLAAAWIIIIFLAVGAVIWLTVTSMAN